MSPCDEFPLFFDGEMTAPEAVRFREHLWRCQTCQEMMLVALLIESVAVTSAPD